MSENQSSEQMLIHPELSKNVISEADLALLLNVTPEVIGELRRNEGLPVVFLNKRNRIYLVPDILQWLQQRKQRQPLANSGD